MQRFRHALALLCGAEPPLDFCQEWIDDVETDEGYRLQDWVCSQPGTPYWTQGIVLIDAAQVMADTPEEGADHDYDRIHVQRPQT